jgi:hypothetical protein
MRNAYNILIGKFKERRPCNRPRHRWEDNIKLGIEEGARVWTGFAWLRIETGAGLL